VTLEIEAKFRVGSHEPVRERLRALGAQFIERVLETNHILDRADGALRRDGCGLRVRVTSGAGEGGLVRATLTYKGPRRAGALKSREEIEVEVGSGERLVEMLHRLGFQTVLWYEKRRESWGLEDCRVELDEPPRLGLFVEIEGPDEERIRAVQLDLGLRDEQLVRESYVELLCDFCREAGVAHGRLPLSKLS
jgi:adenylate cyclase, class 2